MRQVHSVYEVLTPLHPTAASFSPFNLKSTTKVRHYQQLLQVKFKQGYILECTHMNMTVPLPSLGINRGPLT